MALGRQGDRQSDLVVTWKEMPRSPGHVFYGRLQGVLIDTGFDACAERACKPYYAAKMGAPSIPPGRYFRMHIIGYFEGIDLERGIEWRCADSLSLREFRRLRTTGRVPDHSWLSKTRSRLPHEVHETVFGWVLALIAEHGLVKGERIGVDASTMEANAALRTIVRRDSGETYREMLKRMAEESHMRQFLDRASMSFAAGAFGALINSLAVWAAGEYHLTARLDIAIVPGLTPNWLYPRIVWGGLWGFLFMLPVVRGHWWLRGIILSLLPSAFQLLYVFPYETDRGLFGLGLGALTPAFVLVANAIWGLSAAWLLRMTGRA